MDEGEGEHCVGVQGPKISFQRQNIVVSIACKWRLYMGKIRWRLDSALIVHSGGGTIWDTS